MTDSTPAVKKTPQAYKAKVPIAKVTKEKSSGGVGFAIIFSLAALAGAGFTWYQTQVNQVRDESNLAIGVTEIGGQVTRLGDSIFLLKQQQSNVVLEDHLSVKLREISNVVDDKIKTIAEQQDQLMESVDKINEDLSKGVNSYLLDEVSQLLKLANNSAIFSADSDSAINALILADAQLKGLKDPRFSVVRSKINQEIAALKNAPKVDIESISALLHSISVSVPSLPLANEPESTPMFLHPTPTEKAGWRGEVAELWDEIRDVIQIQKVDQPPKPLLAPQQRYFLNQNLQLTLNKAELALLQGHESIFQQGLADASMWLTDYFDLSNKQVANSMAILAELKNQRINIELPPITGSYQALQAIKGGQ